MSDKTFEIRPVPLPGESFTTVIPSFDAALQRVSGDANALIEERGLIAKGLLPDAQLALQNTNHDPDVNVCKRIPGVGQLELTYDHRGKLSSATVDYENGNKEQAKFKDGHITDDRLRGQFNADYRFYENGKVSSESDAVNHYELDESGKLELGTFLNSDGTFIALRNQKARHEIDLVDKSGTEASLNYDDDLQFQSGELSRDGQKWRLKRDKDGKASVSPEVRERGK